MTVTVGVGCDIARQEGGAGQTVLMTRADDAAATPTVDPADDPYGWLEEISGDRPMAWVAERNATTVAALGSSPEFDRTRTELLEVLDSDTRIPYVVRRGEYLYNFWRDEAHPRGLWRRTTLAGYRGDEPDWQVLLDLDALGEAEGESWVWGGAKVRRPDLTRALVMLSRGGSDAQVTREFDLTTGEFVPDGFTLPEAKSDVSWIDPDTLFVATDFGPGSMTTSGYPRLAKQWRRGTPLESATLVYEGAADDMFIDAYHDPTEGYERDFVSRRIDFWTEELYHRTPDGELVLVDIPPDAQADVHREWLLVETRSPWTVDGTTYPAGALLAARFDAYQAGDRTMTVLFEPTERVFLTAHSWTRNHLILNLLDDVSSRLEVLTPTGSGEWHREQLAGAPEHCTVDILDTEPDLDDEYWLGVAGFLNPPALLRGVAGSTGSTGSTSTAGSTGSVGSAGAGPVAAPAETIKEQPAFFDHAGLVVEQHFATSADGTRVPYFQVGPADPAPAGGRPTLLTGYGGYEIPMLPAYSGMFGRAWLSRGGVYVLANIRGGGEYGPRWHQAALRENRKLAFQDFAAVAQDLIDRGVTSSARLGIEGGSNGGLLMGNMLTGWPELFGAVLIHVPLSDMRRYHRLLAGASWVAEYGDPDDPADWAFLRTYSPYHNVSKDRPYPPVLITTSTKDDRVHPAHARKLAARLEELGQPVSYYENVEGGHAGAADNEQTAFMRALGFRFLWEHLGS